MATAWITIAGMSPSLLQMNRRTEAKRPQPLVHHGALRRPAQLKAGDYLVVPRTYHMVLATLALIIGLLLWVPSLVLMKKSITFMGGYGTGVLAVSLLMFVQVTPRVNRRVVERATTWLRVGVGSNVLIGMLALAFAIVAGAGAAQLIVNLVDCPSQTVESLADIVFPGLPNCSSVTDWTAVYRTPYFATQVLTIQSCLDDQAPTIAFVTVLLLGAVVLLLIAFEQYMADNQTIDLFMRLAGEDRALPTARAAAVTLGQSIGSAKGQPAVNPKREAMRRVILHLGIGALPGEDDDDDDDDDATSVYDEERVVVRATPMAARRRRPDESTM